MTLPDAWPTVEVRVGPYFGTDGRPLEGERVTFEPRVKRIVLLDDTTVVRRITSVTLDAAGEGVAELPVSDDPDTSSTGWTWQVREKFRWGQTYDIDVLTADVAAGIDLSEQAPATENGGSGGGAGGSGASALIVVSGGSVDLPNEQPNGYLVGYKVTAPTTFEGVSFPVGRYIFERDSGAATGWTYRTLAGGTALAPPNGGDATPVIPTAPTFTDPSSTAGDTYTIPSVTGVKYYANSVLKGAGIHAGVGAVTIEATADPGYVLVGGTYSWSYTFDTSGPVDLNTTVLNDTFTKTDGTVLNGSVANTGQTWTAHPSVGVISNGKYVMGNNQLNALIDHGTLPSTWALEVTQTGNGTEDSRRIYARHATIAANGGTIATGLGIFTTWQAGPARLLFRADELPGFVETFNIGSVGSSYAIVPGGTGSSTHVLRVQIVGTAMTFYADGVRIMEGTLSSGYLSGLTGTNVVIQGAATYDNLKVLTA